MTYPTLTIQLPDWVDSFLQGRPTQLTNMEDKMQLVVDLSRTNVDQGTGGPFGAGVFDKLSGQLISPGVNLVTSLNCSLAHAETVALALAQQHIKAYNLSTEERQYELVTSCEPCAMCLGAIAWSGVRRVVYGALTEDAEAIGFDEGHKPAQGTRCLQQDGIEVVPGVLREQAAAVLRYYAERGGNIYNGGRMADD
jgi:tRNA(Arg) A34 adenosine deaminase TadA